MEPTHLCSLVRTSLLQQPITKTLIRLREKVHHPMLRIKYMCILVISVCLFQPFFFLIISVLFVQLQLGEGVVKTGEACYGVLRCDYFSLTCEQDEIIRLGTLRYGLKEQPAVSPAFNPTENSIEDVQE